MRMSKYLVFLGCLLMAPLAFGQEEGGGAYSEVDLEASGTIVGRVRFADEYPPPESIKVTSDNAVCGSQKPDEGFVVDEKNKGLANVVVTIKDIKEGKPFDEIDPVLAQEKCRYFPHVLVFKPKDKLTVWNKDSVLHNVHAFVGEDEEKRTTLFNLAQPPTAAKKKLVRRLLTAAVVNVRCDVHPWMNAYVVPVDNPYYALTAADGSFEIGEVPPGTYTLQAWHELMGTMEKKVRVAADKEAEADFVIEPSE